MAGCTSSQFSGITGCDLSGFVEQEAVSNLELLEKEPMSSEWTDEKHSLYLRSIETSFVHQLFSSMDSSGLYSHLKQASCRKSSEFDESDAADQIIKYGKGKPPPQKARKCRSLLQNSWIQHFSSGDHQFIQANTSFGSHSGNSGGREIYTSTLATISDEFPLCPHISDDSIGEEFSAQNFSEDDDEEITCSLHSTKRLKTLEAEAENHELLD